MNIDFRVYFRRLCTAMLVCSLLLGSLSTLTAEGEKEPRRERGPGMGMRGMGGAPSIIQLAANPAVQKDLGLSAEQVNSTGKLGEEYGTELRESMTTGLQGLRDLSPEEQLKKRPELMAARSETIKKLTEKHKPKLLEILDEKQEVRLQQIYWQSLRGEVVSNPEVAEKLKITADQKGKIDTINKESSEETQKLVAAGFEGDVQARFAKMQEINESRDEKLLGVLTEEQRQELEELKGSKFDLSQLRGRGGRGGFGGGRPERRPEAKPEGEKSK